MNWWVCNVMCTYLLVLYANVYGINKTVIVASRWFLHYLTYTDDTRSNTNQVFNLLTTFAKNVSSLLQYTIQHFFKFLFSLYYMVLMKNSCQNSVDVISSVTSSPSPIVPISPSFFLTRRSITLIQ